MFRQMIMAAAWLFTLLCTLPAFMLIKDALTKPDISAPQQASLAGLACAFVVVPYVLARALEGILGRPKE